MKQLVVGLLLHKYCGNTCIARVRLDTCRDSMVVVAQQRVQGEAVFQLIEGLLALRCPLEFCILLEQLVQWRATAKKVVNEATVEVGKA